MLKDEKNWQHCYRSPNQKTWTGRVDSTSPERFHEVMICHDLLKENIPENKENSVCCVALIGFASDEGVTRNLGRAGAAEGPSAFRAAFAGLPLPSPTEKFKIYDFGDIICEDKNLESSQSALGSLVATVIKQGYFPIVIGGGHEVAWAHFQGLRSAYPSSKISVVNFDAHFDLRPVNKLGNSGTSFTQIALDCKERNIDFNYFCYGIQQTSNTQSLFAKAQDLGVAFVTAQDFYADPDKVTTLTQSVTEAKEKIYVTICLDVFSAACAPGVSAPQPLGILPRDILPILEKLIKSGNVIGIDFAELNPKYDVDGITAKLAAHMVTKQLRWLRLNPTQK